MIRPLKYGIGFIHQGYLTTKDLEIFGGSSSTSRRSRPAITSNLHSAHLFVIADEIESMLHSQVVRLSSILIP